MKIKCWKVDISLSKATKTPLWGFYKYSPCSCGCTNTYGIGLLLYWFGVRVEK